MSAAGVWIAAFIENCLTSYETGQRNPGLVWEDDGSNIRFSQPMQQQALINTLIERNDVPIANLSDSDTQIDAILSRESVEQYNSEYPKQPLSKDGCRGYYLRLESFELVYEYSTGKPKVHLYVKRFRVAWDKVKVKGPPSGRSVGKKPSLAAVLKRVFNATKSQGRRNFEAVGTKNGFENGFSDILASQATNGQTNRPLKPQQMHQLPSRPVTSAPRITPAHHLVQSSRPVTNAHYSAQSGSLLEHLHTRASENPHPKFGSPRDAVVLNPTRAPEPPKSRVSTIGNAHRRSHEPQVSKPTVRREAASQYEDISSQPFQTQAIAEPERFLRDHDEERNALTTLEPLSPQKVIEKPQSPFSPEQQLKSHLEAAEYANKPPADQVSTSKPVDPWEGMTEIRSADVIVPKDQMAILESDKKPWYPPPVGEPMVSGNVPPALLDEWNRIAFLRNQQASDDKTESVEDEYHTSPSSPIHESTPEPSDTDEGIDWSQSPFRTLTRNVLPPSSPVGEEAGRQKPREATLEKQGSHGELQELRTQDTHGNDSVPEVDKEPTIASRIPVVAEHEALDEATAFNTTRGDERPESDDEKSDAEMGNTADRNSKPEKRAPLAQPATDQDVSGVPANDGDDFDDDSAGPELARQLNPETAGLEDGDDDGNESDGGKSSAEMSISTDTNANFAKETSDVHPETNGTVPAAGNNGKESEPDGGNPGSEMDVETNNQASAPLDRENGPVADDGSSDSEMDVAVPQPLGGSTQQTHLSQAEAGVSSSAPLPESARQVQVVETPAVGLNKSRNPVSSQDAYFPGQDNAGIQSQPHKSSSQSRILNTYPSNEDSRGDASQESSRSVPATAPERLNGLHVMGTPMDSEAPATQPTPWSASTALWTSSAPEVVAASTSGASAQQSQSSKAFSLYRDLPSSSMLSVENQGSPSVQSSAQGTPLRDTRASPLKRFASELGDSERGSPSKRVRTDLKRPIFEGSLRESISNRRQSFKRQKIDIKSSQSLEASDAYERFQGHYPSYKGGFEHFTKQCARLQAFRQGGSLQRSFLWDDFIIKHLEDYSPYIEECVANDTKALTYEEYFAASFSKPTYKRRSLTVEGIDACAAQVVTSEEPSDSKEMKDTETSFTKDIRDQLSAFHTYSSFATPQEPPSQARQSDGDDDDDDDDDDTQWSSSQRSIPDSEPGRVAAVRDLEEPNLDTIHETTEQAAGSDGDGEDETEDEEDEDEDMQDADVDMDMDMDHTGNERASVELGDEEPPSSAIYDWPPSPPRRPPRPSPPQVVIFTPSKNNFRNATPKPSVPIVHPKAQSTPISKDKITPINTGSVPPSIPPAVSKPAHVPENSAEVKAGVGVVEAKSREDEAEAESDEADAEEVQEAGFEAEAESSEEEEEEEQKEDPNENWFLSLRHILPSPPQNQNQDQDQDLNQDQDPQSTWSNDPNTPFKQWARADQDVFCVRNRRGGAHVQLDERGVIRRFERRES